MIVPLKTICFVLITVCVVGFGLQTSNTSRRSNKISNKEPFILRVAVEEWVPHVKVDQDEDGEIHISGPMANLLDILAVSLNFKYVLKRPPDGVWGIPSPNGSWNGMIGMVARNEADIALGPFGLTYSRSRVVEFSTPILIDYYRILLRRPVPEPDPWGFLNPFDVAVWMLTLFSMAVSAFSVTVMWRLVEKYYDDEYNPHYRASTWMETPPSSFEDYVWSTFGVAVSQPYNWTLKSFSGRIMLAMWLLGTLVLSRSYSSALTSLLAVRTANSKYEYLKDLIQDKNVHLIFEKATALVEHMSKVESGIYKELADTAKEGRAHFLASSLLFDAAYTEVRNENYALLVEETTCLKIYSDDFTKYGRCYFYIAKEQYWPLIFCIIGRKGHSLMKSINARIESISAHHLYFKWIADQVPNATACLKANTRVTELQAYRMDELWGIFAVMAGGIVLGTVTFLLEHAREKMKTLFERG